MPQQTVLITTSDPERSVPLAEALKQGSLNLAAAPGAPADIVVAVHDKEPWLRARELLAWGPRVLVFAVGLPEERPPDLPAAADVELWIGAQSAAEMVRQSLEESPQSPGSAAMPAAAFAAVSAAGSVVGPSAGPAPEAEPELVEDASVMEEEAGVLDNAYLVKAEEHSSVPPPQRPRAAPMALPPDLSAEDETFVTRVFYQVKDVDFRAPPPPPPRKNLTGLDKKMAFLRQRVHELERDLARVGFTWQVKQQKVEQVEKIIAGKEAERASAVQRYQQIRDQATRSATSSRDETSALGGRVEALERANAELSAQLQQTIDQYQRELQDLSSRLNQDDQEKNSLIADFRKKMETAQAAFNDLRDKSTRAIADAEARIKLQQHDLEERERMLKNLTEEMTRTRTANEDRVQELKEAVRSREERIVSMTAEVASARAEYTQLSDHAGADRAAIKSLTDRLVAAEEQLTAVRGATMAPVAAPFAPAVPVAPVPVTAPMAVPAPEAPSAGPVASPIPLAVPGLDFASGEGPASGSKGP